MSQLLARLLLTQYDQKNTANSKGHLKPGQNHQPPKAARKQPRPAVGRNKPGLQFLYNSPQSTVQTPIYLASTTSTKPTFATTAISSWSILQEPPSLRIIKLH